MRENEALPKISLVKLGRILICSQGGKTPTFMCSVNILIPHGSHHQMTGIISQKA
jgi:hypothetical protein